MHKSEVDELDRRWIILLVKTTIWINSIIDGLPESEIRQYKIEYIKALEEYAQETKPKNISPKP
jgi:hypothetical protein